MGLFDWLRSLGDAPQDRPRLYVQGSYVRRGLWRNIDAPPRRGDRGFFRGVLRNAHGNVADASPVYETWEDGAGRHIRDSLMDVNDWNAWRTSVGRQPGPHGWGGGQIHYETSPAHWTHQVTREDVQRDFRQTSPPAGWRAMDDRQWGPERPGWRSDQADYRPEEDIQIIGRGGGLFSRLFGAGNDLDRGGGVMPEPRHERPTDYQCGCGDWRCPYN